MQPLRLAANAKPRLVHVFHRRARHEIAHRLAKPAPDVGTTRIIPPPGSPGGRSDGEAKVILAAPSIF